MDWWIDYCNIVSNFSVFAKRYSQISFRFRGKRYQGPIPTIMSNQCPDGIRKMCEVPLEDPLVGISSMFNLTLALTGCMAALRTFGKERIVFMKESQTGMSTLGYFIAKDLAMIPTTLLAPLIFLTVFYTVLVSVSIILYYPLCSLTYI
jgi:hypothetical protein